MAEQSYRVALLVDGLEVPIWVRDLARWATDHPLIELAAVLVQKPTSMASAFRDLVNFEHKLALTSEHRAYAALHSIAGCAAAVIELGAQDDAGNPLDPHALAKIGGLALDVIVRCGGAIPRGPILKTTRDGMVAIVTSADTERPETAGFSEVLRGRPETRFVIERLSAQGEGREVLFEGSVSTSLLHSWNRISLHARAFPYLESTLERLAMGTARPIDVRLQTEPVRTRDLLAYGLRSTRRSLGKAIRRYSGQEFHWQVAFVPDRWCASAFSKGTVIPNPKGAFLADPFTLNVDGTDFVFVEEYPFATRKGVISAYCVQEGRANRIGVVLEEPYHLSFPFVFEHEGHFYMVPESGAGRTVTLYKASNFPSVWEPVKVLLADVPAVDTILFREASRWWMLTTIQGKGPGLNNAELHAFYADDLFGPWTAHKLNPIVMDARKGRNGGFLREKDGTPCRVAQSPGFTFYGAGSAIFRIEELSPETYRETLIREVEPDFFPALDGTHHIHSSGQLTVFDFMRVERPR